MAVSSDSSMHVFNLITGSCLAPAVTRFPFTNHVNLYGKQITSSTCAFISWRKASNVTSVFSAMTARDTFVHINQNICHGGFYKSQEDSCDHCELVSELLNFDALELKRSQVFY